MEINNPFGFLSRFKRWAFAFKELFGVNTKNAVSSWLNKQTGADLTGAEVAMNQFNAGEAEKARDWQEQMDNTKYQRSVADMKAAGVNPALAMSNGVGSTPSGSSASGGGFAYTGVSMSDLIQMILLRSQNRVLAAQAENLSKQGDAAIINAESNSRNAASNERNASTNERNAEINAMLADNQIKIGDSLVTLNESKMREIAQSIEESKSRVSLQGVEKLAMELQYQFDKDTFKTNKELVIQQLAYRAIEMSEMGSVIKLNNELSKNAQTQGEILSAESVGEKLTAEWKQNNPGLVKVLEVAGIGTSVIGNIFHGGFNVSRSKSASSVDVR